ncbi:MAG: B12-binding domain-containing radical SAM protein [Desulfohalobiaceae bacterium]|nr:B12-binding domain-containing radical SAM protein [Desulfohalobiaceae bacterium]
MKHVVLINNSHVENFSVRYLSAYLKDKGFRVSTIHFESTKDEVFQLLSAESLQQLSMYCRECDLVGISLLTTHHLNRSIQISNYLKDRITAKIIWGGVPVISDPRFYLKHADYICVGEGETVIENLLNNKKTHDIKGLAYRGPSGKPVINPVPELIDINKIPIPHLDLDDGFIFKDRRLLPLQKSLPDSLSTYHVISVRGCPFNCSYCLNSTLKRVYSGKGTYFQNVEVERIIRELEWAQENIPHLKRIVIPDDDFFLREDHEIQQLLKLYVKHIHVPIFYLQTNVAHVTASKVRILKESGVQLRYLKIGLQSASSRICKSIFHRPFDEDIFINKLKLLAENDIRVMLDIISDNPYEQFSDKYESIQFLCNIVKHVRGVSSLERPIKMHDHKLMFFPGSKLYAMAEKDGLIPKDYIQRVLAARNTIRKHEEDIDNEALVVALFNRAVTKNRLAGPAYALLCLLRIKPLLQAMIRFNIVRNVDSVLRLGRRISPFAATDRSI